MVGLLIFFFKGGILANETYPVDFLQHNMEMEINIIKCSHKYGVKKLLYLGSSCIYPKHAPQPMPESCLLSGSLEPTNQWYAIAKITGILLVQVRCAFSVSFLLISLFRRTESSTA
jgi:GDP-L-fucose synthase